MVSATISFTRQMKTTFRRCYEALKDRLPITMTAAVGSGVKAFIGVVQSIEEDRNTSPKRWRVTILDE